MKYKTRFVISSLIFLACCGLALNKLAGGILRDIVYSITGTHDTMTNAIINTVLGLLMNFASFFISLNGAAQHAAKYDYIPDYDDMKRFVIIYFGVFVVLYALSAGFAIMTAIQMSDQVSLYLEYSGYQGSFYSFLPFSIITALLNIALLVYMGKYTLKIYDRY